MILQSKGFISLLETDEWKKNRTLDTVAKERRGEGGI
jgi:hypothetical protein